MLTGYSRAHYGRAKSLKESRLRVSGDEPACAADHEPQLLGSLEQAPGRGADFGTELSWGPGAWGAPSQAKLRRRRRSRDEVGL